MSVSGRRFVITGGSSGIGLATARLLVESGAQVGLVARGADRLEEAVASIGDGAWGRVCDVADPEQVQGLADAVQDRWDGLDGLVNNAGVAPMGGVEEADLESWNRCFAVNVTAPFLVTRALLGVLRAGEAPAVVNVSSTLADKAIPGMIAYGPAKAALNQLTRALALELAPSIRVSAVMPAVVDTPIHEARGLSKAQVKGMGRIHPLRRIGQPEDVAQAIAFLLSEEASWMTGTVLPVDGGMLAT
jgi:NAD(P)-dependent dehydrogenase (short-subunit alcohol dehydrogenase family)